MKNPSNENSFYGINPLNNTVIESQVFSNIGGINNDSNQAQGSNKLHGFREPDYARRCQQIVSPRI
jgi:hypothetical protein